MNTQELAALSQKAAAGLLEISAHAIQRMIARRTTTGELKQALLRATVVGAYPVDRYGPSCLIFGRTTTGRPLHVVCTYPNRPLVKIMTAYEPTLAEWLSDFKTRKPA